MLKSQEIFSSTFVVVGWDVNVGVGSERSYLIILDGVVAHVSVIGIGEFGIHQFGEDPSHATFMAC